MKAKIYWWIRYITSCLLIIPTTVITAISVGMMRLATVIAPEVTLHDLSDLYYSLGEITEESS